MSAGAALIAPVFPHPVAFSIPFECVAIPGMDDTRFVGRIARTITIRNYGDEVMVQRGFATSEAIRTLTLPDVLFDTGASMLCMGRDLIDRLGLLRVQEVPVETATADITVGIYEAVKIHFEGRECVSEVLELPAGRPVLFGVLPMERLGMILNPRDNTIEFMPDSGPGTYWRM